MMNLNEFLAKYEGDYDKINFYNYAAYSFPFNYNFLIENYNLSNCYVTKFYKNVYEKLCIEFYKKKEDSFFS